MFFLKQQKNIGPFLGNSMNPNDGVDLGGRVTFTSMNGCFFFFLRGVNVGKYTSRMDLDRFRHVWPPYILGCYLDVPLELRING